AVIRHSSEGTANMLSTNLNMSIINAGDGTNQHPSQALLDALTLKEVFGELQDFRITVCGDILHSRVARSNIALLSKFDIDIAICGPSNFLDNEFSHLKYYDNIDKAVQN